jgi:hypothetical protein
MRSCVFVFPTAWCRTIELFAALEVAKTPAKSIGDLAFDYADDRDSQEALGAIETQNGSRFILQKGSLLFTAIPRN